MTGSSHSNYEELFTYDIISASIVNAYFTVEMDYYSDNACGSGYTITVTQHGKGKNTPIMNDWFRLKENNNVKVTSYGLMYE